MNATDSYPLRMLLLATVTALFTAHSALGQEKPASRITPEHELLKRDVGTWETEITVWPDPDAAPVTSKGLETSRLLPGGLWLETRFAGTMGDTPCVGVGTWGYDPVEKQYVGTWVDSMTPHIVSIRGTYDSKTETMSHVADGRDPASGEKFERKSTLRYLDDGTRLLEAYSTTPDGQTWKMMQVTYKLRAE